MAGRLKARRLWLGVILAVGALVGGVYAASGASDAGLKVYGFGKSEVSFGSAGADVAVAKPKRFVIRVAAKQEVTVTYGITCSTADFDTASKTDQLKDVDAGDYRVAVTVRNPKSCTVNATAFGADDGVVQLRILAEK